MSGIFGLSGYNDKNLEGLIPDKTRESFREYGYFGGGYISPSPRTIVDRIDYSNDTATARVRGPLSAGRRDSAATGNSNFGYFGGGSAVVGSRVDRIDYSNDSAIASVRGSLLIISVNRRNNAATGNNNFGYFGGGTNSPAPGFNSNVDRINYNNDTVDGLIRGPLSLARGNLAASGNSNFGYFGGGGVPGSVSTVDRIDYSNDSASASVRGPLSLARGFLAATGNSNFGYFGGGAPALRSTVDRIDYSNDSVTASVRGPLSFSGRTTATGNSNLGYFLLNNITITRIDYSNDTETSSNRGPITLERSGTAATSSHSFGGTPISQYGVFPKPFGYFGRGGSTSRFDFSNDTSASVSRTSISGVANRTKATGNSNYAWIGGGQFTVSSRVYRFDYSNDNAGGVQRGPLSAARGYFAATGNYNFGYFSGGSDVPGPNTFSIVDRIDYSNDSVTALRRGSLSAVNYSHTGVSNLNYAYFVGGGSGPTTKTWVERINYSNDNASTSYRSPLQNSRRLLASSGNSNFAYVSGGDVGGVVNSIVERIDYASDTSATSVRGPLSLQRRELAGTGNSNFGYFGGGQSPSNTSIIDRIDYSNDTATASTRGTTTLNGVVDYGISPLTPSSAFSSAQLPLGFSNTDFQPTSTFFDIQSMRRIEDTTNASVKKRSLGSYGYYGGGSSILSRIDFSNDLETSSSRSVVVITSNEAYAGTGNNNFGYFGGGYISTPSSGGTSTVGRVDYSNDNAICSIRGPLSTSLRLQSASGTLNFGYFAGGISGGSTRSIITRIDYSNDILTSQNRSNMKFSKTVMGFTSNSNFGYLAAGFLFPSTAYSNVERINYSNDNISTNVRGNLSSIKNNGFNLYFGSTGNSNFGYFGGGGVPGSISTVDRIDYSNDTVTASVRGSLSVARRNQAATGNSNFGYFGGGGVPGSVSTVDRIDYSNDSASASVRGPLSFPRQPHCATTNARNS